MHPDEFKLPKLKVTVARVEGFMWVNTESMLSFAH